MIAELPLKCPITTGARSGDSLTAKGEGWQVDADPRSYGVIFQGAGVIRKYDSVSSDARTNLQRGFEALRNHLNKGKT